MYMVLVGRVTYTLHENQAEKKYRSTKHGFVNIILFGFL